jgi:dTDP-4-amino-4,6-dideoxygalactose transaminase
MEKLAYLGGPKAYPKPLPPHVTTDEKDIESAVRVLRKGLLSGYEGSNNELFMGGPEVQQLETEWREYFGVKHAFAVNSATSGLYCAVGAAGCGPGDEVIVTPWTMSASAAAILGYNAIPIFADIEPDYFNIDPESIRKKISERTRAIMVVNLMGQSANMDPIMEIARKHKLYIIEDSAQADGAYYNGRLSGTIGHIGVFSLNSNKLVQSGEGGVVVTNDDELAHRVSLIRNHAEAVIGTGMPVGSLVNMLGWNYRMTEVEAAISRVQLTKLKGEIEARRKLVERFTKGVVEMDGLVPPKVRPGSTHVYYRYPIKLDRSKIPINAQKLVQLLNAEGLSFETGFTPLYMQPLYQQKIVYGDKGCPFSCPFYGKEISYPKGLCPVAERMEDEVITTEIIRPPLTIKDIDRMVEAFRKVLYYREQLPEIVKGIS